MRERPVDNRAVGTIDRDTLAFRCEREAVAVSGLHNAGLDQLDIVLAHPAGRIPRGARQGTGSGPSGRAVPAALKNTTTINSLHAQQQSARNPISVATTNG